MAHNLTIRKDGTVEFAYVKENPWHGLGKYLGDAPVTREVMLREAGLDWTVELRELFFELPNTGARVPIGSHVATIRGDTNELLGLVSKDYKPIQQREAFDFMDRLVEAAGGAHYETAGSLKGGQQVFALVKLPEVIEVTSQDHVGQYLLLLNSHDGATAFRCGFTPIRVVCDNTLSASLARWERALADWITVRHVGAVDAKIEEARRLLGLSIKFFQVAGGYYKAMSAREIGNAGARAYFSSVLPMPEAPADDAPDSERGRHLIRLDQAKQTQQLLAQLFAGEASGGSLPGVAGTLWGAYNAITEWVDHVRVATRKGEPRRGAFEGAVFGEGARIKQRAFDEAVALLK